MARNSIIVGDRRRQNLFGVRGAAGVPRVDRRRRRREKDRITWILVAGAGLLIAVWTVGIFLVPSVRFTMPSPRAQAGVESASTLASLFGALVLFLFPGDRGGLRRRWVASGLVVLGIGGLVFGDGLPMLSVAPDLNTSTYVSFAVRTLAGALFAVGLILESPPALSRRSVLFTVGLLSAIGAVTAGMADHLPRLMDITSLSESAGRSDLILHSITGWHWTLSTIPLALAVMAVVGAGGRFRGHALPGWLVVAMVLLAGSQLHNMFWPSAYNSVVSTGDLLSLAFAAVVVVGGVLELRRIAAERAALLTAEQEQSRRLEELAVLKAQFTAMLAHELGSPVAAIRGFADMLATHEMRPDEQALVVNAIRNEADLLTSIIANVQSAATLEQEDFDIRARPVALRMLLADTATFAKTLPGEHPLIMRVATHEKVWVDPERISQVLHNLLNNSAKYSLPGTPIEVRTSRSGDRVRIQTVDHGFGIHPGDLTRIFEKFGRGRDQFGRKVSGVGLGLYVSRRIVQAHGSDLTVNSTPGAGSTFEFELEAVL